MTQEEKQLLIKDLSARLLYGVICACGFHNGHVQQKKLLKIMSYTTHPYCVELDNGEYMPSAYMLDDIKPYLRPMSSMTEEECMELSKMIPCETDAWKYIKTPVPLYIANVEQFDFFNSHHLDWRGLINKGLALKASEDMYKN